MRHTGATLHRDCGRGGLRLDDYERLAEEYVSSRKPGAPLLSRDEVLAVRLYSGPAYQPINSYLRQVAALQGRHRAALASDPALTFAQTCRHLAAAVRKLAAVATAEELAAPLWRGVRGERRSITINVTPPIVFDAPPSPRP